MADPQAPLSETTQPTKIVEGVDPSERDNAMVWDGRAGHYEVWYLTLSDPATRTGFWIRYTLEAPRLGDGEPYAQLWFARFSASEPDRTFGVNRRFPIAELSATPSPFSVRIGDARLEHDGMRSGIEAPGQSIRWDLRWTPRGGTHRHLPDFAYTLPVDTRVLSPNLDVAVTGEIAVNDDRYTLSGAPGGQTHVWGKKHAYAWAWSHCNAFEGAGGSLENAAFEGLSVRLKRGQVILPNLTLLGLHLDGEELAFQKVWALPLARSQYQTGRYHLIASSPESQVEALFTCRPDDMVLTEYLDPDGDPAFCHNTCCADARVVVRRRSPFVGRFREDRVLTARGLAHFEWGARAGDVVNVRKQHRPV